MVDISGTAKLVELRCGSASEFIDVLNPAAGVFADPTESYLYRGQSSASLSLVPSAFRFGRELLLSNHWWGTPFPTVLTQCQAEAETLKRFFDIAAAQGLRLPEDSPVLRDRIEDWTQLGPLYRAAPGTSVIWPPIELYSLIALAQHYGVSTRALDWTLHSWTAAYFAASSVDPSGENYLSVWVLGRKVERLERMSAAWLRGDVGELVFFTAAGADNANLRAQRGVFMLQRHDVNNEPNRSMIVEPYDVVFSRVPSAILGGPIYRVTAHVREAPMILAALAAAGITPAALFPGFWGVARQLDEERSYQWDEEVLTNAAKNVNAQLASFFKSSSGA